MMPLGNATTIGFDGAPVALWVPTIPTTTMSADGTPVAFNDVPRVGTSYPELVILDKPEPALRHWWKVPQAGGLTDGPQPAMNAVLDYCSATDGTTYILQKNALRRLDPKNGQMTTWLH
jgi:hypothetical protein